VRQELAASDSFKPKPFLRFRLVPELVSAGAPSQHGAEMATQHAGSCLCGEVRYAISGSFDRFYLCHCAHCRKDTGSAHAANLFSATAKPTLPCGAA
jgi:hypothetical protein